MSSSTQIDKAIADRQSAESTLNSRQGLAAFIAWKYSKGASGQPPPAPQNNEQLPHVDATYQIVRFWDKWSSLATAVVALGLLKIFSLTLLKTDVVREKIVFPFARWLSSVLNISTPEIKQNVILILTFLTLLVIATFIAQQIISAFVTRLLANRINKSSDPYETVHTMAEVIRRSGRTDYAKRFKFKGNDPRVNLASPNSASFEAWSLSSFGASLGIAFALLMVITKLMK